MNKKIELDEALQNLGVQYYTKIGDGKRASFYVSISEYKKETRVMFLTVNERSAWIGGKYSLPADLIHDLILSLMRVEDKLEKMQRR